MSSRRNTLFYLVVTILFFLVQLWKLDLPLSLVSDSVQQDGSVLSWEHREFPLEFQDRYIAGSIFFGLHTVLLMSGEFASSMRYRDYLPHNLLISASIVGANTAYVLFSYLSDSNTLLYTFSGIYSTVTYDPALASFLAANIGIMALLVSQILAGFLTSGDEGTDEHTLDLSAFAMVTGMMVLSYIMADIARGISLLHGTNFQDLLSLTALATIPVLILVGLLLAEPARRLAGQVMERAGRASEERPPLLVIAGYILTSLLCLMAFLVIRGYVTEEEYPLTSLFYLQYLLAGVAIGHVAEKYHRTQKIRQVASYVMAALVIFLLASSVVVSYELHAEADQVLDSGGTELGIVFLPTGSNATSLSGELQYVDTIPNSSATESARMVFNAVGVLTSMDGGFNMSCHRISELYHDGSPIADSDGVYDIEYRFGRGTSLTFGFNATIQFQGREAVLALEESGACLAVTGFAGAAPQSAT